MKFSKYLILGLIVSALIFSCKKDETEITPSDKKETNPTDTTDNGDNTPKGLEIKNWDVQTATAEININYTLNSLVFDTSVTINLIGRFSVCEQDFYLEFADNYDLNVKKGNNASCSVVKDTTECTWNMNIDTTKLHLSSNFLVLDDQVKQLLDSDTAIYTIDEFSSTKFDISQIISKTLTTEDYNNNKEFFDNLVDLSTIELMPGLTWTLLLSSGDIPYTVNMNCDMIPYTE